MADKFGGHMMQAALENTLTRPGGVSILGVPIDPPQITVDTYVLAVRPTTSPHGKTASDPRDARAATATFVLARGGHAIVVSRPPGSPAEPATGPAG